MMQLNDRTIESMGLDQNRLLKDLPYCVDSGAIVLEDLRKSYAKREKDWFSRYNAINPRKREIYKKLVERFL
jgi:hypothetical protein